MKKPNYENKRLKLNASLGGYNAGATIKIRTDKNGTPLNEYWRRRVKDAEIDNCVEFVKTPKIDKKKEE